MAAGEQRGDRNERGERRTGSPQGWEEGKSEGIGIPPLQGNFIFQTNVPSLAPLISSACAETQHIIHFSSLVSGSFFSLLFFFFFGVIALSARRLLHHTNTETHLETSTQSIFDRFKPATHLNIKERSLGAGWDGVLAMERR